MNAPFFRLTSVTKMKKLGFLLWMSLLFPTPISAQLFQWTGPTGVIHFTDNWHSVPDSLKDSPYLIIREDFNLRERPAETSTAPDTPKQELVRPPDMVRPPEPEPSKASAPVIYNPQYFNIVVVNTIVRHSKRDNCGLARCQPTPVFRPNFNDRRYIHPSVFTGGPHQYIHPEVFSSTRR